MSSNLQSTAHNLHKQKLTLVPEVKTVKETYSTKSNVFITDFQEYMIKTARTNETGSPFKWWYNLNRLFRLLDYMISYMEYISDFVKETPKQISDLNASVDKLRDDLTMKINKNSNDISGLKDNVTGLDNRIRNIEGTLDTEGATQLTVSELANTEITSGGIVVKGKEQA